MIGGVLNRKESKFNSISTPIKNSVYIFKEGEKNVP
jgi:hypothetical protein